MSERAVGVSGVGSWPAVGSRDAVRAVRDLLLGDLSDRVGIPYLPEQPSRGPGADMIGRTAGLLVGMSADLQPSGWRLTPGAGRDTRRAESYLQQDLDELAEAYAGYSGPLKVQVVGPWTLAAGLWLPRGERVVSDYGAIRDVAASLAAGVGEHLDHVRRLVPDAELVLQFDEPSLPLVQRGQVRKASGYGTLRAPGRALVEETLRTFVSAVGGHAERVIAHCCAPEVPLDVLRCDGVDGIALDISLLGQPSFEELGECVDSGVELWAGIVPTTTTTNHPGQFVEHFLRLWKRIGFGTEDLNKVVVTPACGLGLASPPDALRVQRLAAEAAAMLMDSAR